MFPGGKPWQAGRHLAPGLAALGRRGMAWQAELPAGVGGRDDGIRR
jgi:hypothetical protein